MKSVFLGLLLATASAGAARPSPAQADTPTGDPAAVLSQSASIYHDASNLQLKGTKVREQHDEFVDEVRRTPFVLILTPDNKARQESKTASGTTIQVWDGEKHWTYIPQTNRYSSAPGTPNPVSLFRTAIDLRFITTGLLSAKFLRQESIDVGGAPRFCDVIEAHYDRPRQSAATEFGDVAFWIDHQSRLVWKTRMPVIVQTSVLGTHMAYTETTIYDDVRLSQDLPANVFTFTPPAGAREQTAEAGDPGAMFVGRAAPDFQLRNLDGGQTQLSAFKGQVVLLDFWATWCAPCRAIMPKLNDLSREFKKQQVAVIGIDDNEDEQTVRNFLRKNHCDYPVLLSPRTDPVMERYTVNSLPTLVLIDRNGVVADYTRGDGSETEGMLRADIARVTAADYVAPKPALTAPQVEAGKP
jgi:thiol-disulfide isomerase/thioredoxin/outer membrane lipoprotein-sorting protein